MGEGLALLILGVGGLALAVVLENLARRRRRRRRLARPVVPPAPAESPAAEPGREPDSPVAAGEEAVLAALAAALEVAQERPGALGHSTWVEPLLSDGYAIALWLEGESLRLSREIEGLLESGGHEAEHTIAESARRRRDLDRRVRQLRDRLDAVHTHTRSRTKQPPGRS